MSDQKQQKFLSLYEPAHDSFERFCRARACGQIEFRDLMNVKFTITETTTANELAGISSQAQRAGIHYTYVRDFKKKLIREFNVDMYLNENNVASTVQVCVPKGGTFQISFGWYVNEQGKAVAFMDDVYQIEAEQKYPLRITIARNMTQLYYEKGIQYIEQNFDELIKNADPKGPDDHILNRAGYIFLQQNAVSEAIDLFELNVRLFPLKANTWDSLGEAYYKNGEKEKALKAFQKALSIDPKLASSKSWIKKIISENE